VLTSTARDVVKSNCCNWIILDGDIDPEWIESLNSVLDDNHILTLPTGERISFASNTCFIFETDSLIYASPATVSRMGMIYLNN
jgi:dynein heavy chain 2